MEIEKTKVNLKTNKTQLLKEKNSLVVKRKELRVKITAINVVRSSNISIRSQQDPLLKLT